MAMKGIISGKSWTLAFILVCTGMTALLFGFSVERFQRNLVLVGAMRSLGTLSSNSKLMWQNLADSRAFGVPDDLRQAVLAERHFGAESWLLALHSGCAAIPEEQLAPGVNGAAQGVDLFHVGICLSLLGRHADAAQSWHRMHQPGLAERILYTSQHLAESCCPDVAERLVNSVDLLGYESAEAYFRLGHYHRYRGEIDLALEFYTQAAQRAPDEPHYSYMLGVYLYLFGRPQDAVYWLEHAIELRPGDSEAMLLLGRAYRDSGRLG